MGKNSVFSEICYNESSSLLKIRDDDDDDDDEDDDDENNDNGHKGDDVTRSVIKHKIDVDNEKTYMRTTQTLTECQLLHHIDTQIIECIEKLETIDAMHGTVTTERRNILDLVPGADCVTMKVLQEYSQLGLLFTYNIGAKPTIFYSDQIMSSLKR